MVGDALSRRLGLVGAVRWLRRRRVTFSSVGVDGRVVWVVEVCMVEIGVVFGAVVRVVLGAMEDVGLLLEERLDKRLGVTDWVGLDWVGESGED